MAARHGRRLETNLPTKVFPELINGTMARHIPGSSNASGIWNLLSVIPIPFLLESKTRRCFGLPTGARPGRNSPACEPTAHVHAGNPGPAACASTRFFSIRAMRTEFLSPFRLREHFGPTTGGKPGNRLTRGCDLN